MTVRASGGHPKNVPENELEPTKFNPSQADRASATDRVWIGAYRSRHSPRSKRFQRSTISCRPVYLALLLPQTSTTRCFVMNAPT